MYQFAGRGVAAAAQAAQMHARPRAAGGTHVSNSSLNDTVTHQQGWFGSPPPAIAHALPAPQSGHAPGGTGSCAAGESASLLLT